MDNKNRKEMIEKAKLLSPFEIKDELIHIAKKSQEKSTDQMLNAGGEGILTGQHQLQEEHFLH